MRRTRQTGEYRKALHYFLGAALTISLFLFGSKGQCMAVNAPPPSDLHHCNYSDDIYQNDASLMARKAPTHFALIASRYRQMIQAERGYFCTGTTTVAFDGHTYRQAGLSDDPGIAESIPWVSLLTGLPMGSSFDLTALTVILLGVLIGYAGYWRLCPGKRWAGLVVFLGIGLLEAKVGDVYVFQLSPLLAGIPWILYFAVIDNTFLLGLTAASLNFLASWCSFIRSGTTLLCISFLVTLFLGCFPARKALTLSLLVFLASAPALILNHQMIVHRNMLLASLGARPTGVNSHPVWHSVYIGLGFIPNSEVPAYRDEVAAEKVRSIDPAAEYTSAKYEAILRSEVFRLAKQKPLLLLTNILLKAGMVSILACILLFPARKHVFADSDTAWMNAAFLVAMLMSASGAILVAPLVPYLLTFLGLTALFSSVLLGQDRRLASPATGQRAA